MLIGFLEDGTILVLADLNEAQREVESFVVEEASVTFYDDAGRLLEPRFPQRSDRRFLGMRIDNNPGPFELILSANSAARPITAALAQATYLAPNEWFATLEELRAYFRAPAG